MCMVIQFTWTVHLTDKHHFCFRFHLFLLFTMEQAVVVFSSVLLLKNRRKFKKKRKRSVWTRQWLLDRNEKGFHNNLIKELDDSFPDLYKNFVRLPKNLFIVLLEKIKSKIEKMNFLRESISAETRLLITLRFLATGESFTSLGYQFRVSKAAISLMIPEVCEAIHDALKTDHLKVL